MIRAISLEDFGDTSPGPALPAASQATASQDTMGAYDEGYKSGWEDCAKAEAETNRQIGADLATNLREITWTHESARQSILDSLTPLFEQIVSQLLPRLAAEAIAPRVSAELRDLADTTSVAEVELTVAPASQSALETLLEQQHDLNIILRTEPAFAEGQVSVRMSGQRRDIDLSDTTERIAEAIRDFLGQNRPEQPVAARLADGVA